jgi:hypothetical protein
MIRGLAVAALLLSVGAAPADEAKPPVSLEATVVPSGRRDERLIPALRVRLVGVAKDAAVVTDGLSVKVARGDKTATVSLSPAERTDEKGRRIVPSADRLGVVRLQPGEVAVVHVPFSLDLRRALEAAVAGEAVLVVEYEVSEAWGKRFGVVAAKLRGTAAVTK